MFEIDPSAVVIDCAGRTLALDRPRIMGIVNVTPDSFSDGGRHASTEAAVAHALRLAEEGADILDIGGESTRPGADPVPLDEELRRVIPVIEALVRDSDRIVSVDTRHAEVMRAAIAAGAGMVNDVAALRGEGALSAVADSAAAVCLMHMQGEPGSMQDAPHYDDVIGEVRRFLADRILACELAGILRRRIVIDPGFGFGKTSEHNLALLAGLDRFADLGVPLLAGLSRKRTIGELTGRDEPAQRLHGSVAAAVLAAERGARILRVHDVAATRDALRVQAAVAAAAGRLPSARAGAAPAIRWPDDE
ncbi:dihydropteroate synthase [Pseudofulvimonas gallinarii]|jgi:dihydropteroate synthase|uniref:Dihydropteroate synthase n=2 Tax=Pseudofulvimonas gallinarii TaxID=634155 RepID=A0A4R3LGK7_9GAMM|nr:dihydropteroate synthase [Pseudofulvimonas gallinarii]TCS99311.1 dihydropteroate synthase [Pseudofulvimonas gallinarii]THD13891.1 dihydropteroate synthase [Pseudofulvimonas gallinarii]